MAVMGVRAYARHRGVSHTAVQKAIKDQRLVTAVSRDPKGRPLIDAAKADKEWLFSGREFDERAKTKLKKYNEMQSKAQARGEDPPPIPGDPLPLPKALQVVPDAQPLELIQDPVSPVIETKQAEPVIQKKQKESPDATEGDDPGDNYGERVGDQTTMDFARARADKEQYAAKAARIKYEKELGIVVDAQAVEKKWIEVAAIVRTKVLALPSKIRGRLPGLTSTDYVIIEKLTLETLQDLSDEQP